MYFTHPQIKLNRENLKKILASFLKKPDLENLKKLLSFYFPEKQFLFTDMGRTAFRLIVEKLNLKNSQMLMPAYICDIFYPILKKYNIKPIFLDIDLKTFNIQPEEIERKITPQTKSILVSHTYGLPANLEKLLGLAKQHNLLVIEDCAHSLGARFQGKYTGNFGDVAFFSLYKQFPSLRGGLLVFGKNFEVNLIKTSFNFRDFLSFLNCFAIFSFFFKKFGSEIAPKMLRKEKTEKPSKINRVSLNLFSAFLKDFEKDLKRRVKLASYFQEELRELGFETQDSENNVFCYLSALVPLNLDRDKLVKDLRRYKIFATRIWHTPIILNREVQREQKIDLDEFKNTVEAAKRVVNFPLQNYYTEKHIEKIISAVKKAKSFGNPQSFSPTCMNRSIIREG